MSTPDKEQLSTTQYDSKTNVSNKIEELKNKFVSLSASAGQLEYSYKCIPDDLVQIYSEMKGIKHEWLTLESSLKKSQNESTGSPSIRSTKKKQSV